MSKNVKSEMMSGAFFMERNGMKRPSRYTVVCTGQLAKARQESLGAEGRRNVKKHNFLFDTSDFREFCRHAHMSGPHFFLESAKQAWSRAWLKRAAEWVVDLVIVFVGVYAAFLLNNYESRREQIDRRDQLLLWLDDYCSEAAANLGNEKTLIQEAITDFNSRMNNGEMPELAYVSISSSYDSTFTISFFQAGAGELLDVGTLRQLRAVDKDSKLAAENIRHFQELTAWVLVPELNHDRTFFYDPSTRKLLPQYAWYPAAFQDMVDYCNKILPEIDELRKRISEERKRNR